MSRTKSKSQRNREPLRLAFYGLATSELDIFTEVRRRERSSLVLVVDPGPMAIAKRLAEIAGVQASSDPWDLTKAEVDWIVTGKLVRAPGAPLRRAREGGVTVLDVAEAVKRLEGLECRGDVADSLAAELEPSAAGAAKAASGSTQRPTLGEREQPGVKSKAAVPDSEESAFAVAREDWAPPLYEKAVAASVGEGEYPKSLPAGEGAASASADGAPSLTEANRAQENAGAGDERVVAEEIEAKEETKASEETKAPGKVKAAKRARDAEETRGTEVAPAAEESHIAERISAPEETTTPEEILVSRGEEPPPDGKSAYRRRRVESPLLRPTEGRFESAHIVNWALEGMISSVRGSWGVALARSDGDIHLVERGIDLRAERPDLWEWLRDSVEREGQADAVPPQGSDKLVWVPLRVNSSLVGVVLLGTHSGSEGFSQSDRLWLEKVGERITSILCSTASSTVIETSDSGPIAPDSVWAAPALERAAWAREWLREHFEAAGCWLFATLEDSPEPRLIDEDWGSASPPFFSSTVREAMELYEPQVWVELGGERCHVIQPLAPWGVKWLVVLEGVPWRGEGTATLARLKKYAATLARVLKNT